MSQSGDNESLLEVVVWGPQAGLGDLGHFRNHVRSFLHMMLRDEDRLLYIMGQNSIDEVNMLRPGAEL